MTRKMQNAKQYRSSVRLRFLAVVTGLALAAASLVASTPAAHAAECTGNAIFCENQKPGTPRSVWDINGVGDDSIQGFATKISVNVGTSVSFKVDTDASAYTIKIYRLGYYGGDGAREVAQLNPSASLPQVQPSCADSDETEIYDCGTWKVSATWAVPSSAVSGVYIARLIRSDTGGDSHIPFIVRKDGNTSDVLFQTSDTTWQAYNTYGQSDFYTGRDNGRAYKVSYNRPFNTRGDVRGRDFLFSNEYPMIRFLEANGYDVSYVSGLDTHSDGNLLSKHKAFLSVGHDEYWSGPQRDHVTAARDAGTNLAFFSGNEVYWKTRWEPSQDGTNTANRTLVCYKDTWANAPIDPVTATATWRDPRFGDLGHGPENELTGTIYKANYTDLAIQVSSAEGKLRLWRNTAVASLASGNTATLAPHTVGYESDEDLDNGYRPKGLIRMSTTVGPTPEYLTDFGNTVEPGTTTHHLTQYRADSGALVFGAGTVQWAWGLDTNHDGEVEPVDPRIQQATINVLADMSAQPTTVMPGLVVAAKSADTSAPSTTVTAPQSDSSIAQGSLITVKGTAADTGGGRVGGVEVSVDGGASWHPADGRESFTYQGILTGSGPGAVQVRATDDSGNTQTSPTKINIDSQCPCSIFGAMTPTAPDSNDDADVTVGTRFTTTENGFITGLRFYKSTANTGTHTGHLFSASGEQLATVTFANETASGWQTATFGSAVPVTSGSTYVIAYYAPNGHYAADARFFSARGHTSGILTAPGGPSESNGVFADGEGFPADSYQQTNYYVDPVYSATDTTPLSVASTSPLADATSVQTSASLSATFSRAVQASSVTFVVLDTASQPVPGNTTYDASSRRVTFTPDQPLAQGATYAVTVNAAADGYGPMPAPHQWTFDTVRAPSQPGICPCSLFDESDQPTGAPESESTRLELGVSFEPQLDGVINGVKFWKPAGSNQDYSVSLWTANGGKLASADVTEESSSGWQQVLFASPVAVQSGVGYIASFTAPAGTYAAKADGLAAAITRPPLTTPSRAGRYEYGSGAPLSKSDTNYFVDPIFNTPSDQAPEVVSISPGDEATSVPVNSAIHVSFNAPVQPGSATVTVKDGGDSVVTGTTTSESVTSTVGFIPSESLAPATSYTVTVSGAKSMSGTPMTGPTTTTFTTAGATACPCSLLGSTAVPTTLDSGDPDAVTLGLRFHATVDGFAKGLRFYRAAANDGVHTGALYSSDGDKLAEVSFPSQGVGWQTATFSSAVQLTAGETYVASYFAPNGHYSVATNYFDNSVSNNPLIADEGAGVFKYGEGFPNASFLNSHYFVDVVFETNDTSPPAVKSVTPASDSIKAKINKPISAQFTSAIDATTLSIRVSTAGSAVSGQISYDTGSRTASFQPAVDLAYSTPYSVEVTASSAAGVAMTAPYEWQFSTTAAPPPGQQVSLFTQGDTPATAAESDADAVTLGVRFSLNTDATVTAIRFYVGSGNTGKKVTLWAANGAQLAEGTASDTTTGWRTVDLDTPVAITADTTYVASYFAPTGHYASTGGMFNQATASGHFTVPAQGGVFTYADGFPTSSYQGTNYWVDVVAVIPE